ncbi:tRNA 2-selenouridine(34) synthase MnmH [Acidovorax sp. SRB_14]|uniref:tRNA 2-selenouridine(34) synthase MnmH n=1 Tax=Acidovorax sp. SRB_14 TaxID=1962699 RepID=UPI00156592C0|nr:tRNA 2-selenouridine(34) synthase MnmH [Acidovorax sp. SRB_14]NMM82089.1 tRNA 2-selenouridine(34) synthase MnmH [Acidovorax sp. SRB_14]
MSHRSPVRVHERHAFDTLIDARSPAEFALDHIPGAINCPVLDDEERHTVGTLYKQQGAFEARRVGGAMVAANLARHLRGVLADRPATWKPLVYCWRGGMRSGSMVTWLRLVGWDAQQLAGGYKGWRRHVIDQIEAVAPQLDLRVLCGPTGSAKTRVLQALAARGAQVLDLEACARHRGSVLGAWPGVAQPSQTAFETLLVQALEPLDRQRPIYVEAESSKIGRLAVPQPLVQRLRASPCIEIQASSAARLDYLLRDYANLGDDPEQLARQLGTLRELHGTPVIERWQAWAHARALAPLFAELVALHYDPLYARSQSTHLFQWAGRQAVVASDLSPTGIETVADRVLALAP